MSEEKTINPSLSIPVEMDKSSLYSILKSFGYDDSFCEMFSGVRFAFDLMDHQIEGIHAGLASSRFGLFNEARTGKTAIMQALCIVFAKHDVKSIFLMPPVLFTQFEMEFNKIQEHGLNLMKFVFSPKKRSELIGQWFKDHKTSPDALMMSKDIFRKHYSDLRKAGYQAVFFDECHMGCGKESNKVYRAITEFADMATDSRLILSTGTPIPNSLYDLYPLIKLKDPKSYQSRRHYDAEHVTFKQIRIVVRGEEKMIYVPDHDQYRNMDKLNRNLLKSAVRRTKQEVLGLDAPNVQIVPIQLSNSHMKLYRKVMKDRVFEVGEEMIDARAQQKLRQVALQLAVNPDIASEEGSVKENAVVDAVKALLESVGVGSETKVVLFATYNKTVEMLSASLSSYNPATIYGPNGEQKNRQNLTKFKEDGTSRLLIANPIAGGVGITAGDVSDTVIFVEPVSTPAAFDQAASRVILKGQNKPVSVYILKILGTVSPSLIDLMTGKAETMIEVTRDKKSVFDSLLGRG